MRTIRGRSTWIGLAVVVLLCAAPPALAGPKYKKFNITGVSATNPTTGNEGCTITSGTDTCTVNIPAGLTNNGDVAQEFVTQCGAPFTVSRVGNEVTICHPDTTPKLKKVNIKNNDATCVTVDIDLESNNLIEVRGQAVGGGQVTVSNGPILATIPTFPGQTAEQVVDDLVRALEPQTDFGTPDYAYGTEYTAADFDGPPLDDVDLGIWQLGNLDLIQTQFFSTDPGIQVTQDACMIGTQYCVANANSTGSSADLDTVGSASASAGDLVLHSSPVPNQNGIFFHGQSQAQTPFGNGWLCTQGNLRRGALVSAAGNLATYAYDNSNAQHSLLSFVGQVRHFQHWFRDPMGGGALFNTSNALRIPIHP